MRLGEYELVRLLATGGMAEVYEARRPGPRGFAKRVALKRILPQLAMDDRLVRMFCAEARVHAALTHPNLVSVLDFGEASGELYLVMEYVDGVSLAEIMRAALARKQSLALGPALYIAREVAAGLAYAHQYRDDDDAPLGVVHRDVAPNNILLGRAGEVKLTDFGIVRSSWSDVRTAPGELRGKLGYVSPEQALGQPVDARSDLFSLGVVVAEMLLGRPLIPGGNALEILRNLQHGSWNQLSALVSKAPQPVTRLLQAVLARSPQERLASAQIFADELDRLAIAEGVRMSAHALSAWLADTGVVRIDSNVRRSTSSVSGPLSIEVDVPPARPEQATLVDDEGLTPLYIAVPSDLRASALPPQSKPASSAPPALRYRLRRPGGEVVGPLSLCSVLAMLATARAGLDSDLAREEGPFLKLSRAFELTRLASRPLYRFFEPIALLASERHPIERVALPAHLLRLILDRRTGLVCYRHGAEQRRFYIEEGTLGMTASTEPSELLGAQLVRAGLVNEADMERVLDSGYRSGCPIGESLVRANLITQEQLLENLRAQRVRRLLALARASAGELFFVEGARSGDATLGAAESPLAPWLEALRTAYSSAELAGFLSGLERTALSPSAACAELKRSLCSSVDEAYAFDLAVRGVKVGLILREAQGRGQPAVHAAALAIFLGLSAGAFVARAD
jgi:serine/threonine protein kinase